MREGFVPMPVALQAKFPGIASLAVHPADYDAFMRALRIAHVCLLSGGRTGGWLRIHEHPQIVVGLGIALDTAGKPMHYVQP